MVSLERPHEELVVIGRIVRSIGLKGVVLVIPETGDLERFHALQRVYLRTRNGAVSIAVPDRLVRKDRKFQIGFKGMIRLEDIQEFLGGDLCVPESERWTLPEGSYYHSDLIDMDVVSEDGTPLGRLEDILESPANDIFVVRNGRREVLIPAIRSVVIAVDLSGKRMIIRPIEGLLEDHAV